MMENTFISTGISQNLIDALKKQNITVPTKIQTVCIKPILEGADVIGCSETGSGKTLAYLLPLFMKINKDEISNQAVIVSPTHELAIQIFKVIEKLSADSGSGITSAQCIGGANIIRQIDKLKKRPHIIVGTAGRILELIDKGKISAEIATLIIDEADKMLDDMNFDMLLKLVKKLKRINRQTVLFSASINKDTVKRAGAITKNAQFIKTSQAPVINPDIVHCFLECDQRDKITVLRKIYSAVAGRALVFINADNNVAELAGKLSFHKLKVEALHGRFKKFERKQALENFRKGASRFLISSDIAARGLDIRDVDMVINLDIPEVELDYLHRSGRTARAGAKGVAISIVTPFEQKVLLKYSKNLKFDLLKASITKGIFKIH